MKYKLYVFCGAASYGILSTIVSKAYERGFTLQEVVGSQLFLGCLFSWLAVLWTRWQKKFKPTSFPFDENRKLKMTMANRMTLLLAGIPIAATGLLYYESLNYVSNSLAILLLFQFTWIGPLFQALLHKRKPGKNLMITLMILLSGTLLAAGVLDGQAPKYSWTGISLGLGAACSYSLFVLFNGRIVRWAQPDLRNAWMVTGGLSLAWVLFPPQFLFNGTLFDGLLVFGVLLGFFGAFLPPILYAIGVPQVGEGTTSILGAVELPVAVLLSAFVLHEQISLLRWIGVAIVLFGIAWPEIQKRREKERIR